MSVTIHDLAHLLGVDASTVSRALHDDPRISPKTKARIKALAARQGYVMNLAARNLAAGKTGMVALIMNSVVSPLRAIPADAMNDVLAAHGYTLMILLHNGTRESLEKCIAKLEQKICDAAVLIPPADDCFTPQTLKRIKDLSMPFCFLDCWQPKTERPAVTTHVEQSIRMLMDKVIPEHPDAAFLAPPANNTVSRARFQWETKLLDAHHIIWCAEPHALQDFLLRHSPKKLAVFADSPWYTEHFLDKLAPEPQPTFIGAMFDSWENTPPTRYAKIFLCIQNFSEIGRQTAYLILKLLHKQTLEQPFLQIAPAQINTFCQKTPESLT